MDKKLYLDRRFIKIFLLTFGWASLGAGVFLLLGNAVLIGIFLCLLGVFFFLVGFLGRGFKVGYYQNFQIFIVVVSAILILATTYTTRIFMRPPREIYWLIYFLITLCLLGLSTFALLRSVKKGREKRTTTTEV